MAIAVVQNIAPGGSNADQGASSSYTPSSAFTAGNTILVVFSSYSLTGLPTSVTVNGSACTQDKSWLNGTSHEGLAIWRLSNIAASGNVVVNWSGAGSPDGNYILRGILEVSGLDPSPVDQAPTATTGTSTSASITSGTTTVASELVLAAMAIVGSDATLTQPSGYTSIANIGTWSTDAAGAFAYKIVSSTGAQTATWGLSPSGTWGAILVTYKGATGGGGTTNQAVAGKYRILN
jgi:hypothetical protein